MDYRIAGKNAVVLAGSEGLGRAVADGLLAEDCNVAVCSRTQAKVDAFVAEASGRAIGRAADVSKADDLAAFFDFVNRDLGSVDILVTNCGGPPPGRFEDFEDDAWRGAFDSILMSAVRSMRRVLPGMQKRGWGRIVAITSIAVKSPSKNLILSNSLRAGLTGCLKTLASETGADGVTVNAVCPGYTATERLNSLIEHRAREAGIDAPEMGARMSAEVPIGRLATPAEFASLVCYLCSQQAAAINGVSFQADGGLHRGLL